MMRNSRRSRLMAAVMLPASFVCLPAMAAWDVVTQLDVAVEADDNPRMLPESALQESDSRGVLDARVRADSVGQRGQFWVEPRILARSYSDSTNADLEKEDLFLRSRADYRWPNVELGYQADLSRRSIRDAELVEARPDDPDIEIPEGFDTGELVLLRQNVNRRVFRPFVNYRFSERTRIFFETELADVYYSGPATEERTDFTDTTFSIGLERRVDERNRVSASFFVSEFEADRNLNVTDTVGVQASFVRPLSETLNINLSVGLQRSDYGFFDTENMVLVDNADSSFTINVGFRNRSERTTMNFDVGQQIYPNGAGFLVRRDELRFFVRRLFSERLTGELGLRTFRNRVVGDVAAGTERDYSRIELELQWAWTERWSLRGGYAFTDQEFINRELSSADASMIYFGMTYRGLSQAGR